MLSGCGDNVGKMACHGVSSQKPGTKDEISQSTSDVQRGNLEDAASSHQQSAALPWNALFVLAMVLPYIVTVADPPCIRCNYSKPDYDESCATLG